MKNCPNCDSDLLFVSESAGIGAEGWYQKVL